MEKKKKVLRILARVLAIVTALVCILCMVIPSYAEETATEQDLAATIAEQEEKLNRMLRPIGYELNYSQYLLSQGKTYGDIIGVGEIDSDFPTYGRNNTNWLDGGLGGELCVWADLRNSSNEVVWSVSEIRVERLYISTENGVSYVYFRKSGEQTYARIYFDAEGEWYKVDVATLGAQTQYSFTDGYHFSAFFITTDTRINPYLKIACSRNWSVDPSMLLSIDVSASNEEVYNQGYQAGYNEGLEEGIDRGEVTGYNEGYNTGLWEGHQNGYNEGYDDGMTQMSLIDLVTGILRAPMTLIESALNFDIFGINMSNAVKALVSMALLAVVITIVWKAVK